ncbi:MAG: GNAT family N-acetyltransferase [Bacteriovorax sp.]|nr:GNAT family N-acetyltransferase [Bacteriovorax sp.]
MHQQNEEIKYYRLRGEEGRKFVDELANLRINVFRDYPYLYEGDVTYEKKYLETYFNSEYSFILLLQHNEKFIGATTAIWAQDEGQEFRDPFEKYGLDPKNICYFGESILLQEYRGQGLGKVFFKEREDFARSLGFIKYIAFCAVIRPEDHPLKPVNYRPLDDFWKSQGFHLVDKLTTEYSWKDLNSSFETSKKMQYWLKSISI